MKFGHLDWRNHFYIPFWNIWNGQQKSYTYLEICWMGRSNFLCFFRKMQYRASF